MPNRSSTKTGLMNDSDSATDPDRRRHGSLQQPNSPLDRTPHCHLLRKPPTISSTSSMTPDLTPIHTISIGIAIAVATATAASALLTLVYAQTIRNFLTRIKVLTPIRYPSPTSGQPPSPSIMSYPNPNKMWAGQIWQPTPQ